MLQKLSLSKGLQQGSREAQPRIQLSFPLSHRSEARLLVVSVGGLSGLLQFSVGLVEQFLGFGRVSTHVKLIG
jgi:hypothetical protein